METFSALLALCAGNSPVTVNSPHRGQWRGASMFSLIYAWTNGWVNNRDAGDLRRHRADYDVTVMYLAISRHSGGYKAKCVLQSFFANQLFGVSLCHLGKNGRRSLAGYRDVRAPMKWLRSALFIKWTIKFVRGRSKFRLDEFYRYIHTDIFYVYT